MDEDNEKSVSLKELYEYVKRFHQSDSLFVIATVNSAFKYGFKGMNTDGIPEGTVRWLNEHFKEEVPRAQLCMQLTRLARFILLSRANDYRSVVMDTGTRELSEAHNLVSNLHEPEIEGEIKTHEDIVRMMGRMSQWQFPLQIRRDAIMGRGYLLFIDIPSALTLEYDFDSKMREHYGIGLFEFMSAGLAIWIMTNGVMKHKLDVQIEALKDVVTTENLEKFVELCSGTHHRYTSLIREEEQITKLIDSMPQRVKQLRLHNEVGALDEIGFREEIVELKEAEKKHKKRLEEIRGEMAQSTLSESYLKTFEFFNREYKKKLDDLVENRKEASELLHKLIERIVVYSRPVTVDDKVAGQRKKDQRIANRIHIKFKLPQEILEEISMQGGIEKAPYAGASSSQKIDASAR